MKSEKVKDCPYRGERKGEIVGKMAWRYYRTCSAPLKERVIPRHIKMVNGVPKSVPAEKPECAYHGNMPLARCPFANPEKEEK